MTQRLFVAIVASSKIIKTSSVFLDTISCDGFSKMCGEGKDQK